MAANGQLIHIYSEKKMLLHSAILLCVIFAQLVIWMTFRKYMKMSLVLNANMIFEYFDRFYAHICGALTL